MCRTLIALFSILLTGPLFAADVAIFNGSAAVASQSEADREAGLRAAFRRALIKSSGDVSIDQDPALAGVLARAPTLVRNYSYSEHMQQSADGVAALALQIDAEFDPAGVERALQDLDRPLWGRERPTALVWLVIDNNGSKQIASAFQQSALGALTSTAAMRGLPIQLPRMDGADSNRINPVTLWEAPPATIIGASQRYNARVIVVARLQKLSDRWTARYTLIDGHEFESWDGADALASGVLAAAINGSVDRIARRYAIDTREPGLGEITFWIDDVRSVADYARVMAYLAKLPVAGAVAPQGAQSGRLQVRMQLSVGMQRFRQLLAFDRVLSLEPGLAQSTEPAAFSLRLAH